MKSRQRKQITESLFVFMLVLQSMLVGISALMTERTQQVQEPVAEVSESLPASDNTRIKTLEVQLRDHLEKLPGKWSVYVKIIRSGEELRIHDQRMISASLIKIFVAGTFFEKVRSGEIKETEETDKQVRKMLSVSDNDAWTWLERYMGGGSMITGLQAVTSFAHNHGYNDTGRLISTGDIYDKDAANMTSARDVGYALSEIYAGTFVDMEASNFILDALEKQEKTWKIPAGLPADVESANKTGELEGLQHDAAIVFAPAGDYILVIMSEGDSDDRVFNDIAGISSLVYESVGKE